MVRMLPFFLVPVLLVLCVGVPAAAPTEPAHQVLDEARGSALRQPAEGVESKPKLPEVGPEPVELGGICGIDRGCALGCDDDIGAPCSLSCDQTYPLFSPEWYACEDACQVLATQCLYDRGCFILC